MNFLIEQAPEAIITHIEQATQRVQLESRLGNEMWQLTFENGPGAFLKIAGEGSKEDLFEEAQRLQWLEGKVSAPKVLAYCKEEKGEYFLISEVAGLAAHDPKWKENLPLIMELMGKGLRQLHEIDITDCPFDNTLQKEMEIARKRIEEGRIDRPAFMEESKGRKPEQIFETLQENQGIIQELVFTHGDFCMPNIIIDDWKLSGFVDWGIAGVADMHRDLMGVLDSVEHNCGERWIENVFTAYGIDSYSKEKVEYYEMLDWFFVYYT